MGGQRGNYHQSPVEKTNEKEYKLAFMKTGFGPEMDFYVLSRSNSLMEYCGKLYACFRSSLHE